MSFAEQIHAHTVYQRNERYDAQEAHENSSHFRRPLLATPGTKPTKHSDR